MENTENKLPPDFKAKWIAALRSGEYKQGRMKLLSDDGSYCCLGVYARVCGGMSHDQLMSAEGYGLLQKHVGVDLDYTFWVMNDGDLEGDRPAKSFSEIADYIEANL